MAGISSYLAIQDKFTGTLTRAEQSINRVLKAMDAVDRSAMEADVAKAFSDAQDDIEKAKDEIGKTQEKVTGLGEEIGKTNKKVKQQESAWKKISGLVKTAVTAMGAKAAMDQVDQYASNAARLGLINDGLQTQKELQDMIYHAAQRSRSAYSDMVDVVAKLGMLSGDAFGSNAETVKFAELMQKSFALSGASTSEQSAGMYQLTQAMAAGKLQGDEFRSIMENAPMLAQAIADFTGKSKGELKEMSAEGTITADIIKGALFSAGDEIEAKFQQLPVTFGGVWTQIKNYAVQSMGETMERINEFLNSDTGQQIVVGILTAIDIIAQGIAWVLDIVMAVGGFVQENWGIIQPILYGIAAAIAFLVARMAILNTITLVVTAAHKLLKLELLSNPLTWIVLLIVLIVAAIAKWVQSVGGLRVAWLICVDKVLGAWDWVKIAFFTGVYWVIDLWDNMKIKIYEGVVAIQNFMGDMKAGVLMTLQNMVNGAIDIINDFIGILNKIPGVNIDAIEHVTFGTTAQLENEAAKQARQADLDAKKDELEQNIKDRDAKLSAMKAQAAADAAARQVEIADAKVAAAEKSNNKNDMLGNTGGIDLGAMATGGMPVSVDGGDLDSVGKIKNDVNIAEEDLQLLRDVAEMRFVQNFVTLTPTISMDAKISERVDVDEVMGEMERRLEEEFVSAAEGVYA